MIHEGGVVDANFRGALAAGAAAAEAAAVLERVFLCGESLILKKW
jgi:hypothetical protein